MRESEQDFFLDFLLGRVGFAIIDKTAPAGGATGAAKKAVGVRQGGRYIVPVHV